MTDKEEAIAVEIIFLRDLIKAIRELAKSSVNLYENNNDSYFISFICNIGFLDT